MSSTNGMSNAKHTPGNWYETNGFVKSDICGNVRIVAAVADTNGNEQREANARLIAAAPDLLAALSDLLAIEGIEGDRSVAINKAFAAIAKAGGEV